MVSKRLLQLGNILSVVFAIVANYLVATQYFNTPSINVISDKYSSLLTPETYAFSIWTLIYALLVVLAVYQARDFFRPLATNDLPQRLSGFFILANVCNGLWTYIFVNEWIGWSVLVLILLTASLFISIWRLRIALDDEPLATIVCVWWPLLLYAGWVLVASIVNVASWLVSVDVILSAAAVSITIATLGIGLALLLFYRNARELVLASVWGIAAIGVRQLQATGETALAAVALTVSAILIALSVYHAYKNRHANVLKKVFEKT